MRARNPTSILLLAALVAWLPACAEETISSSVEVPGVDAGPPPADAAPATPDAPAGDGTLPKNALIIRSVTPTHGPFAGGNLVTLNGSGFAKGVKITIGGRAIQVGQTRILSPIAVRVRAPAGTVGPADVVAVQGSAKATLPKGYTYDRVYLDPASGPTVGGTLVTLNGTGTSFQKGTKVLLDGKPLTDLEIVSKTILRGKTPPGSSGPKDLRVTGAGGAAIVVKGGFSYYASTSPWAGGLGGGPIKGTLTVSVLNARTRAPIDKAIVYVQRTHRKLTLKGTTNSAGVVVFANKDLAGPLNVTAGKTRFETTTVAQFDARDATLLLTPIVPPSPGPMPPGIRLGTVEGVIMFGGTTGAGSKVWNLVPEPKKGEIKRAYVYATNSSLTQKPPKAGTSNTIDYRNDGKTGWRFSLFVRPGNLAIYAVAGLYNQTTRAFVPYALGITRGVVVGPGERVRKNILVQIPLTERVTVQFKDVPKEVDRHKVVFALDLGADGLIMRDDLEIKAMGKPASVTFSRLPAFHYQELVDAAYTTEVTFNGGKFAGLLPRVIGTVRAAKPTRGVIVIDKFLGVPKNVKPTDFGRIQGNTLEWTSRGAGTASLGFSLLLKTDRTPVWRIITRGDVRKVQLPDPKTVGLPAWPSSLLIWAQWQVHLPSYRFENFSYTHLTSRYWDRSSFDQWTVYGPLP